MKFDYIVANPPYNKTLHLDVFKKCIDTLNDNGELVIIEPATWLIDLKDASTRSNAYKLYTPFKKSQKDILSQQKLKTEMMIFLLQ